MTTVEGSRDVKTRCDLNAKGHPLGATGVAQCFELFQQLRGDAVTQVDGARLRLAHQFGDLIAVPAVTILEGPRGNGG